MVKTTEFNVQTQMNYVVGNMSGFTAAYTGMDNLSALLSSLMTSYTTMAGTGRAAYMSLGAAISAVGLKSAEAFGEYQRGMNMVKAISNNTNAQMQMLSQSAQQFSSQFRMGIEDINSGLVTLGRAGLTDVNNQIEVLKNGLQVAKISGMDLASTLEDIVTTTSLLGGDIKSNTFGSETKEISNLLVATSLSGPLNVSDVIETLKFAGGSAAAAGATLNNEEGLHDLLGTIGAFSQKGVTGSIAGTALRAFITKPASQDQKVSDALARLGLDAYSLWEKDPEQGWHMKPIAEQIGMITKAMNDNHLTNLDRIEVWGDIVGNKMGQQMLKLDENRIKETTKDIEHQRNLEDIYQGTLTNFASQVERLSQIFQAIYRNIGSGFASMLTGVVQGFADILEFVNSIGNGILFKAIAPLLGPLGLYGLGKGLKDFVELLGMLKANIQSSLERPIKGQPLYQPYEDWETSRRGGGYSYGTIHSAGGINVTGPTTIQGDRVSYKDFLKSFKGPEDYRNNPKWQEQAAAAREKIAAYHPHALKGNYLSTSSIFDISLADPSAYTEDELRDLQIYEHKNRAMRYLGEALLESGQLLNDDFTFSQTAIDSFSDALNLDDDGKRNLEQHMRKALKTVKEHYKDLEPIDPHDPEGKKINPEFASALVRQISKRMLDVEFKGKYGQHANFYDFLDKGMNMSMFEGYLNIPYTTLEGKVKSGKIKEGSQEYVRELERANAQYASMKKLGGFNYLGMIDQVITDPFGEKDNSIMRMTYDAVQRGLENVTLTPEVQEKVQKELDSTLKSIEAVESKYLEAGTDVGQAAYKGIIQRGMGIYSPGYIYYKTEEELERVQLLLQEFRAKYGLEGEILGSELVKKFGESATKGIKADQMYKVGELKPKSSKFLTFDVESTGVDTDKDAILQYGAAIFDDGKVIKTHKTQAMKDGRVIEGREGIVKYKSTDGSSFTIPDDSKAIHGLAYEDKRFTGEGQYLEEMQALVQFQGFVEEALGMTIQAAIEAGQKIDVVTHNGTFDFEILRSTIDRVNDSLIQAGVSTEQLIPDLTRVFNKIDLYDEGKGLAPKMLEEHYGRDIVQGVGPKGNISFGLKFLQEFPYDPKAAPGMHELEVADNKLDSFVKLLGIRLTESHDATLDAIDAGTLYLSLLGFPNFGSFPEANFVSRPHSRFFDPTNPTASKDLEELIKTHGDWIGKTPEELLELYPFDRTNMASVHKYEEMTSSALFRGLHTSETSNLDELKKLNINAPLEVLGTINKELDQYALRFYGPLEAIEKKIMQIEELFGPIYKASTPMIDEGTGKALVGITPFSYVVHEDLQELSDYEQELMEKRVDQMRPSKQNPRRIAGSAKKMVGKDGFLEGELSKEEDSELYDEGFRPHSNYDAEFNMRQHYLDNISNQFESKVAATESALKILRKGFDDVGSISYEHVSQAFNTLYDSGLLSFLNIEKPHAGYISRDDDGQAFFNVDEDDLADYADEHGLSKPKPLSVGKGIEMLLDDPYSLLYKDLDDELYSWVRGVEDKIESTRKQIAEGTYIRDKLPRDPDFRDANQYLMRLYSLDHPEDERLQEYNRTKGNTVRTKRKFENWDNTNLENAIDTIMYQLLEDGKLTPKGRAFVKDYQLGFANNPNEYYLRQEVEKQLRDDNLYSKYHTPASQSPYLFSPEEDNTSISETIGNRMAHPSVYSDYDHEAEYVVRWDDSSLAAQIGQGMIPGLNTLEDVINMANMSGDVWYLDEQNRLHNSAYENPVTKEQGKDSSELARQLLKMESIFKENNEHGFYYNFKNVRDKSFKTIDDINEYKKVREAYEKVSGRWVGGADYISREDALRNFDELDSDEIQKIKDRAKYERYAGMDARYAGIAARDAQKNALNPIPSKDAAPILSKLADEEKREAVEQFKIEVEKYLQKNAHLLSSGKKSESRFAKDIQGIASGLGLSLDDMIMPVHESEKNIAQVGTVLSDGLHVMEENVREAIPTVGAVLRELGSTGIQQFLYGIQAKSPPKAFMDFIGWVGKLSTWVLEKTPAFGAAAFTFGRTFDTQFRNGAQFHSPVKAIDDFNKQADKDLTKGNEVLGQNLRKMTQTVNQIGEQLTIGLEKPMKAIEKLHFINENMTALSNTLENPNYDFSSVPQLKKALEQDYDTLLSYQKEIQKTLPTIFIADTYTEIPELQAAVMAKRVFNSDKWDPMKWAAESYQPPVAKSSSLEDLLTSLPGVGLSTVRSVMDKDLDYRDPNNPRATIDGLAKHIFIYSDRLQKYNPPMQKVIWGLIQKQIQDVLPKQLSDDLFGSNLQNLSVESFSRFLDMSPQQLTELAKKHNLRGDLEKAGQHFYDQFSYERTQYDNGQYRWKKNLTDTGSLIEDNFGGIKGIGEKTLKKLGMNYNINTLLSAADEDIEKIIGASKFKLLQPHLQQIRTMQEAVAKEAEMRANAITPSYNPPISIKDAFENVSGVGVKSIAKLEEAFGNISNLAQATPNEIYKAIGNKRIFKAIWNSMYPSQTGVYLNPRVPTPEEKAERTRIKELNEVVASLRKSKSRAVIKEKPHLSAEEFLAKREKRFKSQITPITPKEAYNRLNEPLSANERLRNYIYNSSKSIQKERTPEQKLQERNQRAIEKWTQELIKGAMTQEQYGALLDGLTLSGQNFEAELQKANANLLKFSNELLTGTFEDEAARDELRGKIQQEIATIESLNEAKRRETTASIAAAEADMQESVTGRLGSIAGSIGGAAGKLVNGMFGLMMNPYAMVLQMVWGYVQQGIEYIKQQEEEKISKLSEIASNAESSYEEQTSKWEEAQSKANEKFGDLSDNEKQDQMLEAIQKAREDNNSASAETKALLGKQNALISSSDNMINAKMNQRLTGYNGVQANWEEFMQGSGMVGSKDEFGLMDYLEGLINPDKFKNDSNTARIQAMADATIQIDTRVKNMEEMTEDYQKVMASFGVAGRSMLDIYNVRGILSDDFFSGTFFDPNSSQRIGAPGFRSAEQLASLMKREEKILQRFENRYLRFTRSTTGQGDRITVTLGDGSIHDLANQLGVKDVEAAQMLAVHELQRIQDVMLNQVEPQLAQTAISMYQGAYTLEENKNLNDVQAAFQNTMTQGIFAIQSQVAQLVYKATMEQALADYQAATGDTETDTIGLLLNRARDTSYEHHDVAKQYASQGWGGFMQARDLNHLVNQGYTQEEAMNKLLEQGKDGDYYKKLYGEQLGKYEYSDNSFGIEALKFLSPLLGNELERYLNYNNYDEFSKYTDWMMKSYAENVPLDDAIKTLNDAQVAADEEGDNGKETEDDADKQRYVQLAICNKKAIPKLNVNLFKKAPTFTVLNKNFKLRDIKINTADKAKNIENSLKNAIIDVQERSDPKIIQDSEGEYDPVGATDDATNLPTGASLTK